jgi:hypothetical protein
MRSEGAMADNDPNDADNAAIMAPITSHLPLRR